MKSLGAKPMLFPLPVLMVATYSEDGSVNVMNAAWGGIYDDDKVVLALSPGHKTSANIRARRAFTLSVADKAHMTEADYFGIATGNKSTDKFAKSGLTAEKSSKVDAPVVTDFPITVECEVTDLIEEPETLHVIGRIKDVLVKDEILDDKGKVDITKAGALIYDTFSSSYYTIGEKAGRAFHEGAALMKK